MIGVTHDYRRGAVELFGQHRARQQMRPRRLAEGEQQIGRAAIVIGMAIGSADHKAAFAHPVVAPLAHVGNAAFLRESLWNRCLQPGISRLFHDENMANIPTIDEKD